MRRSMASGEKPVEQAGKLRARKAKLQAERGPGSRGTQIEQALQRSNEEWENTFNAISDWVAVTDVKGRILRTNRAGEDFTGISSADIVGQLCCKLIHGSEKHIPGCPLPRMLDTGQRASAEIEVPGSDCWLMVTVDPVVDERGNLIGVVHIACDITERKKMQEALRESEEKYRDLFENAQEGIITIDLKARITSANKLVEEYGLKRKDLIGKKLFDFVPEYDRARAVSDFEILVGGKAVKGQMDVITPRGIITVEYRDTPIVREGKVIGVQAILTDITERKRAEKEIQSLAKFPSENPNPILRIARDGTLLYMNEAGLSRLPEWHLQVGQAVPPMLREVAFQAMDNGSTQVLDLEHSERVYSFFVAPVVDAGYANLYGRDITEHKRAEDEIRKFKTIADRASYGVALSDLEGNLLYLNQSFAQMHEYGIEELIGQHLSIFHSEDQMENVNGLKDVLIREGNYVGQEVWHKRRDGMVFPTLMNGTLIRDEKGEPLFMAATAIDITERKKAEYLLRKESDRSQKYLDVAGVMLVAIDSEQRVGLINKKGCQILGYKEEEILAKNWFDNFLPERIKNEVKAVFKELMVGKVEGVEYLENPILTKNGDERIIGWHNTILRNERGEIIAALGSGEDITERKQVEEALRESEGKYRDLVENMTDVIYSLDTTGNVTSVNEAGRLIYGVGLKETIGRNFAEWIPEKELPKAMAAFKRILSGEKITTETILIDRDGKPHNVEFSSTPVIEGGNVVGTRGIIRDITERKRAEQKLREHEVQLKSLASQLTLAEERERRRIAVELHDRIGQSLAVSKIKLDGLRHSVSPEDPVKVMEQVSSSLGQAIADIRSLTFDLSSPILHELGFEAAVAAWLTDRIEQKHGIATEFEDDEQAKPLDDDIRAILFRNVRELLFNVIKHAHTHKVKVSIRRIGSQICVSVEDDGVGFDPAKVALRSVREGGFGLLSIRERLEQLGGHLRIDSAPGRGCTVTMTAPIKKGVIVHGKI